MAKYKVTYTCGHEGVVNIIGPNKDREWKLAYEEAKLCPDCYKAKLEAERQKQNAEAAEANQTAGLPKLEGTEKQIAWAETIRKSILEGIESKVLSKINPEQKELTLKAFEAIKRQTKASWWIDIRDISISEMKALLAKEADVISKAESEPPDAVVEEAQAEATVYPENSVSNLVAEISIKNNTIQVSFPERNETFRQIMQENNFEWNSGWFRKISKFNGTVEDRAIEIGNKLLTAGFPIRIYDTEIRQKAISGEYEPECKRWVQAMVKGDYKGWLVLSWGGFNDKLYKAAKRIAGSRWHKSDMVVPPENYLEVLDFAKMYGFKISDGAQEVIEVARQRREKALTTGIKSPKAECSPEPGTIPEKLEVPEEVTIDEEFRDEN